MNNRFYLGQSTGRPGALPTETQQVPEPESPQAGETPKMYIISRLIKGRFLEIFAAYCEAKTDSGR